MIKKTIIATAFCVSVTSGAMLVSADEASQVQGPPAPCTAPVETTAPVAAPVSQAPEAPQQYKIMGSRQQDSVTTQAAQATVTAEAPAQSASTNNQSSFVPYQFGTKGAE